MAKCFGGYSVTVIILLLVCSGSGYTLDYHGTSADTPYSYHPIFSSLTGHVSQRVTELLDAVSRLTTATASAIQLDQARAIRAADSAAHAITALSQPGRAVVRDLPPVAPGRDGEGAEPVEVLAQRVQVQGEGAGAGVQAPRQFVNLSPDTPGVVSTSQVLTSDGNTVVESRASSSSGIIQSVVTTPDHSVVTTIDAATGEVIDQRVIPNPNPAAPSTRHRRQVAAQSDALFNNLFFRSFNQYLREIVAAVDVTSRQAAEYAADVMSLSEQVRRQFIESIVGNARASLRNVIPPQEELPVPAEDVVDEGSVATSETVDGAEVMARIPGAPRSTTVGAATYLDRGIIQSVVATEKGSVRTVLDATTGEVISQEVLEAPTQGDDN